MRTTSPSIPRARNAIVGLPLASSASRRCATISASADSDVPHVFSDRETIAATSPDRRSRSGITCARTISCISYGTPGTAYTTLPSPTGQRRPGRGAERVRERLAALGHVGLAQVVLRHVAQPRPEHRGDVLGQIHAAHERHAHQLRDRVARQVVLGRAEPAADEHRVAARRAGRAARRRCASGCRRSPGARRSRCPTPRAARRSRRCWCRRSGRAAARYRSRGLRIACSCSSALGGVAAGPAQVSWRCQSM